MLDQLDITKREFVTSYGATAFLASIFSFMLVNWFWADPELVLGQVFLYELIFYRFPFLAVIVAMLWANYFYSVLLKNSITFGVVFKIGLKITIFSFFSVMTLLSLQGILPSLDLLTNLFGMLSIILIFSFYGLIFFGWLILIFIVMHSGWMWRYKIKDSSDLPP